MKRYKVYNEEKHKMGTCPDCGQEFPIETMYCLKCQKKVKLDDKEKKESYYREEKIDLKDLTKKVSDIVGYDVEETKSVKNDLIDDSAQYDKNKKISVETLKDTNVLYVTMNDGEDKFYFKPIKEFYYREEKIDIKKIIKDLQGNFSGSNEDQYKSINLLKGLAGSDEDLANEFMKELNKATTEISKKLLGDEEKKEEFVKKYLKRTLYK